MLQLAHMIPFDQLSKDVKRGKENKYCLKSYKETGPNLGIYRSLCHLLLIATPLREVLLNWWENWGVERVSNAQYPELMPFFYSKSNKRLHCRTGTGRKESLIPTLKWNHLAFSSGGRSGGLVMTEVSGHWPRYLIWAKKSKRVQGSLCDRI